MTRQVILASRKGPRREQATIDAAYYELHVYIYSDNKPFISGEAKFKSTLKDLLISLVNMARALYVYS